MRTRTYAYNDPNAAEPHQKLADLAETLGSMGKEAFNEWVTGAKHRLNNPMSAMAEAFMDTIPTVEIKDGKYEVGNLGLGMGAATAYRGLTKLNDPKIASEAPVTWVTPEAKYANEYAGNEPGANIIKLDDGDPVKGMDFGFRDQNIDVTKENMLDRLQTRLMDEFKDGNISKEKGMDINDLIQDTIDEAKPEYKKSWELYNDKDILGITKAMGFDHYIGREGVNNNVPTRGLFNPPRELLDIP